MFHSEIDVAEIMREIKSNIVPEVFESSSDDELQRITDFINNTRNNSEEYVNIGYILPNTAKYPPIIRKIVILVLRVIRKLSRFIINDQIVFNKNTVACIKALVEREDAIVRKVAELREEDREREKELQQEKERKRELQREIEREKALQQEIEREKALQQEIERQGEQQKEKDILLESKINKLSSRIDQLEERKKIASLITDEMYLKFEENFRGTEGDICERQEFYVNRYLKDKTFDSNDIAIDLGCGRGEWLKRINELGLHAVGIDTNIRMIDECKKKGMEAKAYDALSYIRELDDNSVSIISAFQLIEHMPKSDVFILVREAYRVLKPQGVLILETPNICNIEVGASTFHLDPTHINPMHPDFIQFLAEYTGYETAEIAYWKQENIEEWLLSVMQQEDKNILDSAMFRTVFETVKRLIYSSPDYALVATK